MKLGNISPNQCSFFISGTKLGAGTFMSHNINEDLSYINDKKMVDLRGEYIGKRPPFNQVFFGITILQIIPYSIVSEPFRILWKDPDSMPFLSYCRLTNQ